MKLARTIGTVTLAKSHPAMTGAQLRCVEVVESIDQVDTFPLGGETIVAWDLCGSGVGACIAANKIRGIRAGVCHDVYTAAQCVEHDDVNVLCLGARVIGPVIVKRLVETFLEANFKPEERYVRRLNKILSIEDKSHQNNEN